MYGLVLAAVGRGTMSWWSRPGTDGLGVGDGRGGLAARRFGVAAGSSRAQWTDLHPSLTESLAGVADHWLPTYNMRLPLKFWLPIGSAGRTSGTLVELGRITGARRGWDNSEWRVGALDEAVANGYN